MIEVSLNQESIMRFLQTILRLHVLSLILLTLGACETEKRIGDQTLPLMGAGEGLIANSAVYQNPNSPVHMKAGHRTTILTFYYEALDGDKKELLLPLDRHTTLIDSKSARGADDDGDPILMLTRAKPGRYRLRQVRINPSPYKGDYVVPVSDAPVVHVTEGQVTYAGSKRLLHENRWVGGDLRARSFWIQIADDFDIDMNDIKKVEPRLRSLVIKNGMAE